VSGPPSRAEQLAGYRRVLEARALDTPLARLHELAADRVPAVRIAIARNRHTPPEVLQRLADDEYLTVAWYALQHPQMPEIGLRRLADWESRTHGGRSLILREIIAHHPNAPQSLRAEMANAGTCRHTVDCTAAKAVLSRAATAPCEVSGSG
jgi:hypothetical protein